MESESERSFLGLNPFVDRLLQREAEEEYLAEWQQSILLHKKPIEKEQYHPYIFFRLDGEYFALSALLVGEITRLRAMHRLPHVKLPFIEGVVNVNGRLRILISMIKLLQLQKEETPWKPGDFLVLVEKAGFAWTFRVTEVPGIFHVLLASMQQPSATKGTARYIKGLFPWQEHLVGVLDEELLLARLRQSL